MKQIKRIADALVDIAQSLGLLVSIFERIAVALEPTPKPEQPKPKITEAVVDEIEKRVMAGESYRHIENETGVSKSSVARIEKERRVRHRGWVSSSSFHRRYGVKISEPKLAQTVKENGLVSEVFAGRLYVAERDAAVIIKLWNEGRI